jgi:RNA recognition motif-containing protein
MRSAQKVTGLKAKIIMKSQSTGRNSRRQRRGGSRRRFDQRDDRAGSRAPAKKSFWQKVAAFFGGADSSVKSAAPSRNGSSQPQSRNGAPRSERVTRKPESIEVTTPRLYVGNLSFEATESDLFDLFNGVGQVQNAEVVTYKHNERSKGFAFVQMQTIEEAKRAVAELHDKEFLGRKLVVSGAKSDNQSRN